MDKSKMQVFAYDEAMVRTVDIDGEPWFVGKDVAAALGYTNTNNALKDHVDDEDRMGYRIDTPSRGEQEAVIINESGMYSLIFGSKLDSARQFKRWVTSEVLPSIRRTGGYGAADGADICALLQKQISVMEEVRDFVMGRPEAGKPALPPVSRSAPPKESEAIRRKRQVGDVAKFVERFCDVTGDGGDWCKLKELYTTYKRWSPVRPMSRAEFEDALCALYSFVRISARSTRGGNVRSVQGIALKDDWVERLVRCM